jgi:hypothetical protein
MVNALSVEEFDLETTSVSLMQILAPVTLHQGISQTIAACSRQLLICGACGVGFIAAPILP